MLCGIMSELFGVDTRAFFSEGMGSSAGGARKLNTLERLLRSSPSGETHFYAAQYTSRYGELTPLVACVYTS